MRQIGPKNRIARREGIDLGLKTPGSKSYARLLKKINVPPGQHGLGKKRRKASEHGSQLREKQKLRFIFGITEKQMKNYYKKASEIKGNTAFFLAKLLQSRFDNVVYKLGFAPTRASARQLVNHGHIKLNNRLLDIPSAQIKVGDTISFVSDKSAKIPYIAKTIENKDNIIVNWLERKGLVGKMVAEPTSDEIQQQINLRLIIEFYSR